jgi:hypothetical protein
MNKNNETKILASDWWIKIDSPMIGQKNLNSFMIGG